MGGATSQLDIPSLMLLLPFLMPLSVADCGRLQLEGSQFGYFSTLLQVVDNLRLVKILRLAKPIFVNTSVLLRCNFAFVRQILEYCFPVWGSAAECHFQLLERQVYSVARLCPIRVYCRCVIIVVWQGLVC